MITLPGYHIKEQLYKGSNTIVYRAIREDDRRSIVLKILKKEYPTPLELARFRREFEVTHNLQLPGVIITFGLEKYEYSLAIVLEDFGGDSLANVLPHHALTLQEKLLIAMQLTEIIGQIYRNNIIHKDINPSNIIWNPKTGQLKIIDFGISTILAREQSEILNPNVLEGTLAYMSPEQTGRMNRAMDYRTDLYSFGITLYKLFTGKLPFQAEDAMEWVHSHIARTPPPPNTIDPDLPETISLIIEKLIAKNAEERYQSAIGLLADFRRCYNYIRRNQEMSPFAIGEKDVSEKISDTAEIVWPPI